QQQLGLTLDHLHPLPRTAGGALGDRGALRDRLLDLARVRVDLALHERQEEVLLAVEVRIQGAGREGRLGRDLLYRCAVKAAAREDRTRGREEALACVCLAFLARHPRAAVRFRGVCGGCGLHARHATDRMPATAIASVMRASRRARDAAQEAIAREAPAALCAPAGHLAASSRAS